MKLVLLSISSSKDPWVEQAVQEYTKKLNHFIQYEDHQLKAYKVGRDQESTKKKKDSDKLIESLRSQDYVVALSEEGKIFKDSIQFSKQLFEILKRSQRVVLLLGGPFGLTEVAKETAKEVWSLGPLTMSHPVARIMLSEQLYRACMIEYGRSYHNL